jgi:segregation and condensation protein B
MSDDQTKLELVQADPQHVRIVEALLFAAAEPLDEATLLRRLPEGTELAPVMEALVAQHLPRGVNLRKVAERWALFTAPDLAYLLEERREVTRKLSRAGTETLAIIAYHQPITRAEIEELRGVALSKGTLDVLLETGWVRMRGRRRTPGRPVTYGTSDDFLIHFGLPSLDDLPGVDELRAAGLLETQPGLDGLPSPGESLPGREEDPLEDGDDGSDFRPPVGDELPPGEGKPAATESHAGSNG